MYGGYVLQEEDLRDKKSYLEFFTATMFMALCSASAYPTLKIAKFLQT